MVELNAFGMTRRGDLTSPATNDIQSGPPTLVISVGGDGTTMLTRSNTR